VAVDSTEGQFRSWSARGCLVNAILVVFSYSCMAASKSPRKRYNPDWWLISQVGVRVAVEKLFRFGSVSAEIVLDFQSSHGDYYGNDPGRCHVV
jgi:hypothetical protein